MTENSRVHYSTLDGLRGIAALAVVFFHAAPFFSVPRSSVFGVSHGYLAVDFFFALSGLVVAGAYEARLRDARLGFTQFTAIRLIRLMPLMIFVAIVAAALRACLVFLGAPMGDDNALHLIVDLAFALLMLPVLAPTGAGLSAYPLNGPTWSIFFEAAVNLAWALVGVRLRLRWLALIAALSFLSLAARAIRAETIHFGWAKNIDFVTGFPRVVFSFSMGVFCLHLKSRLKKLPTLRFEIIGLLLIFVLCAPVSNNALYDLAAISIVFPALLLLGLRARAPGAAHAIASFLGTVSFAVYAIHHPILHIGHSVLEHTGRAVIPSVWLLVVVPAIVALAFAVHTYIDIPIRAWLTRRFVGRHAPLSSSAL